MMRRHQIPIHQVADRRRRYLALPLMVFFWAATAFASTSVMLTMRESAAISGDTVHVADIADIRGGDPLLQKTLSKTVVGTAPPPGQTRFVGLAYVRLRLKQAGFDPDAMIFKGAADVRLTRTAAALPVEQIRADVTAAIRRRMPWKTEQVAISDVAVDEATVLPSGNLTYQIVFNRNEDYLGNTIVGLHLFVDGEPYRRLWVNATISVTADVVTVVRPLGKHQYIEREHVSVVNRDLADLPADTVRHVADAVGLRATRMIYPGTVLQSSMVDVPPLVNRGDIVRIVAESGTMTITATGLLKEAGRMGEMVRVMNTESKRVIIARVVGPDAVHVDF